MYRGIPRYKFPLGPLGRIYPDTEILCSRTRERSSTDPD